MKNKTALFLLLITIFIVGLAAVVAAQSSTTTPSSTPSFVAVSTSTLSFVGTQGQKQLNRTLTFVGIINQTVDVTLFRTDLYDNNTGETISANNITITPATFDTLDNQTDVNISINTSQTKSGTYQGTILVTTTIYNSTTNSLQIASIQINVSVLIQPGIFILTEPQVWMIVAAILFESFAYLWPDQKITKRLVVVLIALGVTVLWVMILLIYGLNPIGSLLPAISTVAIVPFLGWVTTYLNSKRTSENDKEKSSRAIENDGNKSDIDMIRNVLGELETHYASFKPLPEKVEGTQEIPTISEHAKTLYNESGVISRKVWDTSCKQGAMFDLPVLDLEKYYNFVTIYNRYYSCAIELTKPTKDKKELKKSDIDFLVSFEAFRAAYGELETVLYVDLSYYLGLIVKTNLSPLPVEFPRVTRILLKKCVDYGVLDATKYPGNFLAPSIRKDFFKYLRERTLAKKFSLRRRITKKANVEKQERFKGDFLEEYTKRKFGEQPKGNMISTKNVEDSLDFKRELAKRRIDEWNMSAAGLEDVFNEIYDKDKIPVFYREVRKDFATRIDDLEQTAEKLQPLCKECLEKEEESSLKETETIKELSDELDALEKLLKAKEITNDEYEKMKLILQKKLKQHANL